MGRFVKILATFFLTVIFPLMAFSATIHVPADQPTIQVGIDAAIDGDTVLLAMDIYSGAGNWTLNLIQKNITLKSLNSSDSGIIDCIDNGSIIHNWINIAGYESAVKLIGMTFCLRSQKPYNHFWKAKDREEITHNVAA